MQDWMNQKLESRLPGEISVTSNMQVILPFWQKWGGTEEPLDESEEEEWKNWLKTQHSKTEIMASGPITLCEIDREKMETVTDFIFSG